MCFRWSNGLYGDEFVQKTMTRSRFHAIQRNLHWIDTSGVSEAERNSNNKVDSFWTLKTFLLGLASNYRRFYSVDRDLDIDEMTVPFKGRHRAR